VDRIDPAPDGDELTLLSQYLDYHRTTLLQRCAGLSRAQLGQRHPPSTLTLAGLLKHMALVEDSWFWERMGGNPMPEPFASVDWGADPDWEFHTAPDDDPAELVRMYEAACDRSRQVVREVGDLDAPSGWIRTRRGQDRPVTLRWILLHMVEETARHNGHADLLREAIDGVTGE
jgi:uncharacterized damage-inducible protein DinB